MATLNLTIEVPDTSSISISELRDLLIAYSNMLLNPVLKEGDAPQKRYKHEAMAGILTETDDCEALKYEYVKEKYRLV